MKMSAEHAYVRRTRLLKEASAEAFIVLWAAFMAAKIIL
jgi:hypothetical protein